MRRAREVLADYRSRLRDIYDTQVRHIDALTHGEEIDDRMRRRLLHSALLMTRFHLGHIASAHDKIGDTSGAAFTRQKLAAIDQMLRRR